MKRLLKLPIFTIEHWDSVLLIQVFFLIFIIPLFSVSIHGLLYNIVFTLIYIFAAMAVGRGKKYFLWLALAAIVFEWLSEFLGLTLINDLSKTFSLLFFILIVTQFIARIARAKLVDAKVILDAINGYLLLTMVFSLLVALMMQADPQAFNFPEADSITGLDGFNFANYVYYTLVTITTLGYGEIVPQAPYAKSLATLISISGQFYVAILIALIVGKFAANMSKSKD